MAGVLELDVVGVGGGISGRVVLELQRARAGVEVGDADDDVVRGELVDVGAVDVEGEVAGVGGLIGPPVGAASLGTGLKPGRVLAGGRLDAEGGRCAPRSAPTPLGYIVAARAGGAPASAPASSSAGSRPASKRRTVIAKPPGGGPERSRG
ncbi:hypothetical protein [Kribbella monticola]|uniref:hypothetical protein n=1 Tax=Kribbella monticola TaxID=2185285 RepID=UPI001E5AA90D|nr:hypothetical protein [Kribbella monticola]